MPVPANERFDLSLVKDEGFEYKWEGIENDDSSLVDLTAPTIALSLYDRSNPAILQFQLAPIVKGLGYISFGFTAVQAGISGPYDYVIQITTDPANLVTIAHGILTFVDPELNIPFSDIMTNEIPPGMTIPSSYIATDQAKWRAIFLSKPGNSVLVDATQNDPSTWPMIYNFLIAKLVVFDYLENYLKFIVGGDLVKKITTGPSDVEFVDPEKLLKAYGGVDAVGALKSDICELASTLKIYLVVCGKRTIPYVPELQGLPKCPTRFLIPILNRRYY